MKKCLILFISLFISLGFLYAQAPQIEKSVAFDEPVNGWNKVLQMKNGNTFFFHFTRKEGIEVTVFDKNRKVVSDKTLTSDLWDYRKMRSTVIEGLYEINGEPVLFMVQADGRTPTLYRLRFNPFTGDMVKEEEIGSLPKMKIHTAFSGAIAPSDIYVEKDPASDCYAVVFFNGAAHDRDERIKVQHYDGNHKMINLAYYESPEEDVKFLNFIGAVVDGSKRVYIATYSANSRKGRDAHVYIARLNSTDSEFQVKSLDFTEEFKDTRSVMYYNHTNNTLQLLTLSYATGKTSFFSSGTKHLYMSFLSFIDPETLSMKAVKPLTGDKISEYMHNTLGLEKKDYHGLPQQMIINKDNSITILSEDQSYYIVYDKYGNIVSATTYLGSVGVTELNEDGTEKSGYVIMKVQAAGGIIDPLYIAARNRGRWRYQRGYADHNCFLSYDYVNTEKGRYIIFNDDNRNFEKDEDERRRKVVTRVNKLNTVCYNLNDGNPTKYYLFGDTGDKDRSNSSYIEASDYSKATNTYATVLIERNGSDRQAKLVWVTFQ